MPFAMPLKDALVGLFKAQSVEVDSAQLVEGLPVTSNELPEALLNRAVQRYEYKVVWASGKQLRKLSFPCCLPLSTGEYCVVVSRNDNTLNVQDAQQPSVYHEVTIDELQPLYADRAFQILPGIDRLLEKHSIGADKKHWFWGRLLTHKRALREVVLASLFANTLAVVTALFALQVYDRVIPGQSEATLWVLASGVGLAILFEAILRVSRARLIDRVGKEAEIEITSDIFARMIGMKLDKRPASPGAIVHMVREFSAVKDFFTNAAVGVVSDLPFALIFLFVIYGIAGHVVWIIVLGAILIVLPNILMQGKMVRLSEEAMGGMSSASRLLTEACYGAETVKSTRSEHHFQRQWEEIIALNALKTTEQRSLRAMLTYWATGVQQATYVFAVIACVYLIFNGELSMGAIIAIGILTTRTLSPISQLSQTLSSWQNMKTALGALETVVSSEQERNPNRTYITRPRFEGQLTFEKVRFAHPGTRTLALDINRLAISRGKRLALLGANGSGKSTLLRLAAGLYQPVEGEVMVDGLDLRQVDPADLRRNIGYLPQETQMFRGSLRENLASGNLQYTDDALYDALAFGGLAQFAKQHPEGLDLQIMDGGEGLSIGQRQSIGLARIFLQDPSIILLDEPTSALDQNLENTLVDRLGNWIGSRTCIVATHRPTILTQMTHVAVLKQGRVILEGEKDEALRKLMTPPPGQKVEKQI